MLLWKFTVLLNKLLFKLRPVYMTFPGFCDLSIYLQNLENLGQTGESWERLELVLAFFTSSLKPIIMKEKDESKTDITAMAAELERMGYHGNWLVPWSLLSATTQRIILHETKTLVKMASVLCVVKPKYAIADRLYKYLTVKCEAAGLQLENLLRFDFSPLEHLPAIVVLSSDEAMKAEMTRVLEGDIGFDMLEDVLKECDLPEYIQKLVSSVFGFTRIQESREKELKGIKVPTAEEKAKLQHLQQKNTAMMQTLGGVNLAEMAIKLLGSIQEAKTESFDDILKSVVSPDIEALSKAIGKFDDVDEKDKTNKAADVVGMTPTPSSDRIAKKKNNKKKLLASKSGKSTKSIAAANGNSKTKKVVLNNVSKAGESKKMIPKKKKTATARNVMIGKTVVGSLSTLTTPPPTTTTTTTTTTTE